MGKKYQKCKLLDPTPDATESSTLRVGPEIGVLSWPPDNSKYTQKLETPVQCYITSQYKWTPESKGVTILSLLMPSAKVATDGLHKLTLPSAT